MIVENIDKQFIFSGSRNDKLRNNSQKDSSDAVGRALAGAVSPAESLAQTPSHQRLGRMLVVERVISEEQLSEGLTRKALQGGFLGQHLVDLGHLDQETLTHFLVRQCHVPHIKLLDYQVDPATSSLLEAELCWEHRVIPLDRLGSILTIAMVDPFRDDSLAAVNGVQPKLRVKPILCNMRDFEQAFEQIYGKPVKREEVPAVAVDTPAANPEPQIDAAEEVTGRKVDVESFDTPATIATRREPDASLTWDAFVFDAEAAAESLLDAFVTDPESFGNRALIAGPTGSGKTHLLHATVRRIWQPTPDARMVIDRASHFVRSLDTAPDPDAELFAIDGVGAHLTRREQQMLSEWLDHTSATVVMASAEASIGAGEFSSSLQSRLAAGLVVELEPAPPETLLVLLERECARLRQTIPRDALEALAKYTADVRTMRGALTRLMAESRIRGRAITVASVESHLELNLSERR